jgi:hypothetical protein
LGTLAALVAPVSLFGLVLFIWLYILVGMEGRENGRCASFFVVACLLACLLTMDAGWHCLAWSVRFG